MSLSIHYLEIGILACNNYVPFVDFSFASWIRREGNGKQFLHPIQNPLIVLYIILSLSLSLSFFIYIYIYIIYLFVLNYGLNLE